MQRTSPFPPYDPETANIVYKRNFHITVLLIFITLLYAMAAIGCIIKLTTTTRARWTTAVNLTLFLITIPNYLLIALKADYLRSSWAPLKAMPLILTALTGLVVSGIQGARWEIEWLEAVLLVALPSLIYFLGVVLGKTSVGRLFAPFRIEKKRHDLELAIPIAPPLPTSPPSNTKKKESQKIEEMQRPTVSKKGKLVEDIDRLASQVEIESN